MVPMAEDFVEAMGIFFRRAGNELLNHLIRRLARVNLFSIYPILDTD
jgi:hypothetical protein